MSLETFTIDELAFGNSWHAAKGKPFVEWCQADALEAHKQGSPYCVVFYGAQGRPFAAADIRGGSGDRFIDVRFLGNRGELEVVYYYSSEFEGDRLFLKSAMCFGGKRNTKDLTSHTWRLRHVFEPDGAATTFFFEEGAGTTNTSWKFNASNQWIDFPSFGDFGRLAAMNFGQEWSSNDRHGLGG
jgi:hypothetical protein